jgi:DNA-binding transcriptional LysR family regulator
MSSTPGRTSVSPGTEANGEASRVSLQLLVRGLTFDHLATFKAVAESGSFRRAAEKRLISQPAVSQRIRQLERLVGVSLFDRQRGTSATLTAAGELLVALADDVLEDLEELCGAVRALAAPPTGGSLVVASGPSFIKYALLSVARTFGDRYPDVEVRLQRSMSPDDVMEAVVSRVADLGIYSGPVPTSKVRSFPLAREFLRLVAPRGHPMTSLRGAARMAELSRTPFALSCDGAHSRQLTEAWAQHYGIKLHVRIEADNLDTLKEAVVQGVALAVLPEFAIRQELESGTLTTVDMPGLPMERRLSVIAHAGLPLLPVQQAFIDLLTPSAADS